MLRISLSELCKWVSKKQRKVSWIVKRFGKYRRKVSWIMKRSGKYGRNVFLFFFYKTTNTACNLFKFTLCPTVRGNNSVSEGVNL